MAKMYLSEYPDIGSSGNGRGMQIPVEGDDTVHQTPVTISGTSAQSAAFATGTKIVCVTLDQAGYIVFGSNPTAVTTTQIPMAANTPRFFAVTAGMRVAVVA